MKIYRLFFSGFRDLFRLLFPELCAACGRLLYRAENEVCTICLYQLPYTDHHLYADNKTARKLWGRIPFHAAMSLLHFKKGGSVQELVHQLKYRNRQRLGIQLGRILGEKLASAMLYRNIDYIIPVPLHRNKERSRGYNQSLCIAEGIAHTLNVPILKEVLIRTKASSSQTQKSRYKRYENMKEVFEVRRGARLNGLHILLVDDVITTGATIESCAIVLQQHHIGKLSIAALAFAD